MSLMHRNPATHSRLYMALYTPTGQSLAYSSALLLIPAKDPHSWPSRPSNSKSSNPTGSGFFKIKMTQASGQSLPGGTVRYNVEKKLTWTFKAESSQAKVKSNLVALVFLGDVFVVEEEVRKRVEEVNVGFLRAYKSYDWVWDAIRHLIKKGVITSLVEAPEDIWNRAERIARNNDNLGPNEPVPTYNVWGERIASVME